MNLFELFVKIGVDDQASKNVEKISQKLGKGLKVAAKVGLAAVGAAATGIIALTKQAISSYAEFEQLAGGAAKIFDQMDQTRILNDAQNAYKDLGISMNQYLSMMNSVGATFAATMGDEKGYETARIGMQAISDYASGTGKNIDELSEKFTLITRSTASYQSIADQFSGILPATSADFLKQAQAAGLLSKKYKSLTEVPIDEYQQAVSKMLQEGVQDLGLAGNTVAEATSTISGSLAMTKAAWQNLIIGISDPNADLGTLINNMVDSAGAALKNLLPAIEKSLHGISELVLGLAPIIIKALPNLISGLLPKVLSSVSYLFDAVLESIPSLLLSLSNAIVSSFPLVINGISRGTIQIIKTLPRLMTSIISELTSLAPMLLEGAISLVNEITSNLDSILEPILTSVLEAAPIILTNFTESLLSNIPILISSLTTLTLKLVDAIPEILQGLISAIPSMIQLFVAALINNVPQIILGLGQAVASIVMALPDILMEFGNTLESFFVNAWNSIKAIFSIPSVSKFFGNVWQGIKSAFSATVIWFSNIFTSAWNGIKKAFSSVGSFFTGIWNTIKNIFSKIGGSIGNAVSNAFAKAVNWVLTKAIGIINGFISALNAAIGVINLIPGVSIKKIKKLDVPQLARGGIVDGATLALIGERGKEAVMPLENNTEWIDSIASKLDSKMRNRSYDSQNQRVEIVVSMDDKANMMGFARALLPMLKIAEKEAYA